MADQERLRRPRADAQRNRDAVLAAAIELFAAEGGAVVSLEAVARAAGVGIGTLYRNFPTRTDLVLAVYEHEVDQLVDIAAALLAEHEPLPAFRQWVAHLAQYAIMKQGLAQALREAPGQPELPGASVYERVLDALELLLRANEEAGTMRSGMAAQDVILALAGLLHLNTDGDWHAQADRIVDIVINGLRR